MARGQQAAVGDIRVAPNGYHYTRTKEGWVGTGRLVAGDARGRVLEADERIRFLDKNPLNLDPSNIEVYKTKQGSNRSKLAKLYAKRDEIQAQIEDLELSELAES